jgi:hypothetical protein
MRLGPQSKGGTMDDFFFLGKRVRILPTADSDLGKLHAGEHGEIVHQTGTIREGIREYTIRLDDGELIPLKPHEVEILY